MILYAACYTQSAYKFLRRSRKLSERFLRRQRASFVHLAKTNSTLNRPFISLSRTRSEALSVACAAWPLDCFVGTFTSFTIEHQLSLNYKFKRIKTVGHSFMYTWHGVMNARNLVSRGLISPGTEAEFRRRWSNLTRADSGCGASSKNRRFADESFAPTAGGEALWRGRLLVAHTFSS